MARHARICTPSTIRALRSYSATEPEATGAVGVLCLACPLQPPRGKRPSASPSRLHELDAVTVPTLVVQGARDPFGIPPAAPHRTVVEVAGDHSLRSDLEAVAAAV